MPKIKQSIPTQLKIKPGQQKPVGQIKRENKLYKLVTVNSEANFNVKLENSNIIPQKIDRETTQIHRKTSNVSRRYNSSSGTKSKHRVESIRSLNTSIQSKKD